MTRTHNATIRGDIRATDKDSLFVRWSMDSAGFNAQPLLPEGAQTGVIRDVPARSWGTGYTRVLNAAMVNELRFAYNFVGLTQDATLAKDEIIKGSIDPSVNSGIPTFNVTNYAGIGARPANFDNVPVIKESRVYNLSDNFSWVRGKQTIRTGFDFPVHRRAHVRDAAGPRRVGVHGSVSRRIRSAGRVAGTRWQISFWDCPTTSQSAVRPTRRSEPGIITGTCRTTGT